MKGQLYRRKNKNRPVEIPKNCKDIKKSLENEINLRNYGFAMDKTKLYVDTIICKKNIRFAYSKVMRLPS